MVKNGRCEVVVISLGAAGALMISNEISERILPPGTELCRREDAERLYEGMV